MILKKNQHGFTLIELIIVIIIMGIVAALGARFLAAGVFQIIKINDLSVTQWQGELALEKLTREARPLAQITTMTTTQLTFIDQNGDALTYALSGSQWLRQENANPAQPMMDFVSALTLTYYDATGNITSIAANVHYIGITLVVTRNQSTATLRSLVRLRRLN